MRIAYITTAEPARTDIILAEAVARLEVLGCHLAGTVATDLAGRARRDCGAKLRVLPDGPVIEIAQRPGTGAPVEGPDDAALAEVATRAAGALDGAVALVLNSLGTSECGGSGLLPLIGSALDRGMPVLVGVGTADLPAFLAFARDIAIGLPPNAAQAADWVLSGLCMATRGGPAGAGQVQGWTQAIG